MFSRAKNRLQKLSWIGFRIRLCLLRLPAAQSARGTHNALCRATTRPTTATRRCTRFCRGTGTCHSAGIRRGIGARRRSGIRAGVRIRCGSTTRYGIHTCGSATTFRSSGTRDADRDFASSHRGLTLSPIPNRAEMECLRRPGLRGRWFGSPSPSGPRGRAGGRPARQS
jgi:hypothetical protein